MRRIAIITSSRADWSRGQTIAEALCNRHNGETGTDWLYRRHGGEPDCPLVIYACGSHNSKVYGETAKEIESQVFNVVRLKTLLDGGASTPYSMARSYALACELFAKEFHRWQPDIVVCLTDRYEQLAAASTAALMNIHVAHVQGGEVSGTIDESIRHAITKLAQFHFPATEQSRARIIRMGEPQERVWNFGCPATDLLLRLPDRGRMPGLPDKYLMVVMHPVTTEYEDTPVQSVAVIQAIARFSIPSLVIGGNHDAGAAATPRHAEIFYPYVAHPGFVREMAYASCLVGNSSAGIREACYLGTPVVNVGTRQNRRERGHNVVDAPNDAEAIYQAIERQLAHGRYPVEQLFGDGHAGKRIAEVLATVELGNTQKTIMY